MTALPLVKVKAKGPPPQIGFIKFSFLVALHSLCIGVRLFSVCKTKKAEQVADAYVDNTAHSSNVRTAAIWLWRETLPKENILVVDLERRKSNVGNKE
eukprot:10125870-Ditylum_brightwellii.AAC.1